MGQTATNTVRDVFSNSVGGLAQLGLSELASRALLDNFRSPSGQFLASTPGQALNFGVQAAEAFPAFDTRGFGSPGRRSISLPSLTLSQEGGATTVTRGSGIAESLSAAEAARNEAATDILGLRAQFDQGALRQARDEVFNLAKDRLRRDRDVRVGEVRDAAARARISGSSLAEDTVNRTLSEFGVLESELDAQQAEARAVSILQEAETQANLIQTAGQLRAQNFRDALDLSTLEASIGADLAARFEALNEQNTQARLRAAVDDAIARRNAALGFASDVRSQDVLQGSNLRGLLAEEQAAFGRGIEGVLSPISGAVSTGIRNLLGGGGRTAGGGGANVNPFGIGPGVSGAGTFNPVGGAGAAAAGGGGAGVAGAGAGVPALASGAGFGAAAPGASGLGALTFNPNLAAAAAPGAQAGGLLSAGLGATLATVAPVAAGFLRGAMTLFEPSIKFSDRLNQALQTGNVAEIDKFVESGDGLGLRGEEQRFRRALGTAEELMAIGRADVAARYLTPEVVQEAIAFATSPVSGDGPEQTTQREARNDIVRQLANLHKRGLISVPASFRANRQALFG